MGRNLKAQDLRQKIRRDFVGGKDFHQPLQEYNKVGQTEEEGSLESCPWKESGISFHRKFGLQESPRRGDPAVRRSDSGMAEFWKVHRLEKGLSDTNQVTIAATPVTGAVASLITVAWPRSLTASERPAVLFTFSPLSRDSSPPEIQHAFGEKHHGNLPTNTTFPDCTN